MAEVETLELSTSRKRRNIIIEDQGVKKTYEMLDTSELTLAQRIYLTNLIQGIRDMLAGKMKQDEINNLEADLGEAVRFIVKDSQDIENKLVDEQRLEILNAFSLAQAQPAAEGEKTSRPGIS